jgi:hypothetical protein
MVPTWIDRFVTLLALDLSANQLTELPAELGRLRKLVALNLSDNQLTDLPAELGRLTGLFDLNLEGNPFHEPLASLVTQGQHAVLAYLRSLLPPPHITTGATPPGPSPGG